MDPSRFDLDKTLVSWRRSLEHNPFFTTDDLDELEQHVRDEIAGLCGEGLSREAAFHRAMRQMGDHGTAEREYRKVYWGKRRREGVLLFELHWRTSMLKNYLKIAVRSLLRQKGYAFINLFGLAAGLACFILILLFVQHELSYDTFHEEADRIYRVIQERPTPTGSNFWAVTSPAMAHALVDEFPEVVLATTIGQTNNPLLSVGDDHYQDAGILADERFFEVFTFELQQGNPETALAEPNGIVLTASLARKLFGDADPMGRPVRYQEETVHTVTGVMADVPATSHLRFDYILPARSDFSYRDGQDKPVWYNNGWYTYVVMAPGADPGIVEAKLRALIHTGLSDWRPEDRMTFSLQPLLDIHLRSQDLATLRIEQSGDLTYVYFFLTIGFVILLIACVNYTNLAVARSIKRAREVGMRKVVGAARSQLVGQFLGESMVTAALALVLSLVLVVLLLPVFGHLVERPIRMDFFENGWLLPGLLGLVVVVGFLSGSYPAFMMGALRPIRALSGGYAGQRGRFVIQRLLIVGQYAVSIALIAGSFVVHEQMRFVRQRELGYDREHILSIEANDPALSRNFDAIRNEMLRDPRVVTVSYAKFLPTAVRNTQGMFGWEGSSDGERLPTNTTSVDYDYLDVFGIDVVAGRGFSRAFSTDTLGAPIALINETTARALNWTPEEAVGKQFGYSDGRGARTIIGVVEDFHYNSVHQRLEPLVLTLDHNPTGYIVARIRPEDLPGTIALFEGSVEAYSPYPYVYRFMDEQFDQVYREDQRLGDMFGFFTLLAIVIASLGLFGLAAYATGQRTKEIGIRKVLGANVTGLVALLSKEYLLLVSVAFVLAVPPAYFLLRRWLDTFVYHIDLGPGLFFLAGVAALFVALATVGYQAVRTASANPVKSLRYE